ncbi:hypothetical protein [Massilia rubra]|uniref:Fibronectin type-III domain-containing protein n=1 Tax=Massilia rubra TaxID=2607910 RepID=A0ABX0LQX7_9BURK|nr:hypothetical protein [Massilia rubra]NHZ37271.1 hypothetical protein [Massilia rubra]
MTQASTPTGISSAIDGVNSAILNVTWDGPITDGNGAFLIQFFSRANPSATPVQAPNQPAGGFPVSAAGNNYSVALTFLSADAAKNYNENFQAQVQANATAPNTPSAWGLQVWWNIGFAITVTIGSTSLTLRELPNGIYVLPVSVDNPLTVTYADLKSFVAKLPGAISLPTNFPNGQPISSALQVTAFAIDVKRATFEFDFTALIKWEIFTGLTVDSIGFDIQRTNGVNLLAA